jgi:5'-3' exonuclease
MILIDFSSIIHRMIHTSVKNAKPSMKDGIFVTSEFINLTKYYILQELFAIKQEHSNNFGDIIICLDKSTKKGYWRKDIYPGYKASRRSGRDESNLDYNAIFESVNDMIEQIKNNLPWKVLAVPRAEADDIMLVLAQEFNRSEKILIHSPDKDMIQAQRDTDNVFQYSALTKKYLTADTKADHMERWVQEHCILGDAGDEVPKVVDHTEFTDSFLEFMAENGLEGVQTPMDFRANKMLNDNKALIIQNFDVWKLNRKGESTGVKDIYKSMRFGPTTLQKKIKEHGTVDIWLDSHPLYRPHFNRNFTLVMSEGIPSYIWNEIIVQFKEAEVQYNVADFEDYLITHGLKSILMDLPSVFKINRDLTAKDFGW